MEKKQLFLSGSFKHNHITQGFSTNPSQKHTMKQTLNPKPLSIELDPLLFFFYTLSDLRFPRILTAKEFLILWKLKYFTMQKYNLLKKSFKKKPKSFKIFL
jgi:hypothetical protein